MSTALVQPLCVLLTLYLTAARGCLYEYTSNPAIDFNCDPYDSELQLHCSVTGPLYPHFTLQWYISPANSTSTNQTKLDSETYKISNSVIDTIGDVSKQHRSVSSHLLFSPTLELHADNCIWCQIEFSDLNISVAKEDKRLCLKGADSYIPLDSCGDPIAVVNSSSDCVSFEDLKVAEEQLLELDITTTASSMEDIVATVTSMAASAVTILPTTTIPSPSSSTVTSSLLPPTTPATGPLQPTTDNTNIGINTQSDVTDFSTIETTAPSGGGGPDNAVQAGLFAAIAICVVFILAIIVLMYFVVRLFRQWKWKREKENLSIEGDGVNGNVTAPTSASAIANGYNVERFHIEDSLFLSALDDDVDGILTTRSLQDLTHHQAVPPIPPKSWKKTMTKSSSASALNFRVLSHNYNNFTFPAGVDERQSDPLQSTIPPPVPIRSRSKEHFYHTLECSNTDDSGLVLSSPYSRQSSSRRSSILAMQDTTTEEPAQLRELFDDPRYVALVVEGEGEGMGEEEEEELGLRGRRDVWRSTPTLPSPRLGGRGEQERRSLRLTHVVGTHIYN